MFFQLLKERTPLTLRETNNNYPNDYGSVERLDFRTNEVYLSVELIFIFSKGLLVFQRAMKLIFQLTLVPESQFSYQLDIDEEKTLATLEMTDAPESEGLLTSVQGRY